MLQSFLDDNFLDAYRKQSPDWGYKSGPNSIGELTYARTYSRIKQDGAQEDWVDTLARVVDGTMTLLERHQTAAGQSWDHDKARRGARKMFNAFYNMKALPPGRGLWMQGTDYVMERNDGAPLYNCAFISTDNPDDPAYPYAWLMDMSMLGVGVGFDTLGAGVTVHDPVPYGHTYTIPDTREGWVESVKLLIESYLSPNQLKLHYNYDKIRPKGAPIKGFGGVASGAGPLRKLHERLHRVLGTAAQRGWLSTVDIVDIMNMVGACVVAGNVRRSAELALGSWSDSDFVNAKNYDVNPQRAAWGWASNNSVVIRDGDVPDYADLAARIADNGEPGIFYLDTARAYGRMSDAPDYKDMLAQGTNPCAEIILESGETCNLVEVFPSRCESLEEFLYALKYAYLYAKTVTLMDIHSDITNKVQKINRRLGISLSGIVQFVNDVGMEVAELWTEVGYAYLRDLDRRYSSWLGVPESKRLTTVKPSGSISLLAGVTPGVHYPIHDYYIRRIRLSDDSPLVGMLQQAGYHVEDDVVSDATKVVELPVAGNGLPTERDVSVFDKADIATFMAANWADNAVSATITFDKETESDSIQEVLEKNHGKWKTVSFLPLSDVETHAQMPYEPITPDQYASMVRDLRPIDWSAWRGSDGKLELFCTTDTCEVPVNATIEPIEPAPQVINV